MNTYEVTATVTIEIGAENVVQANNALKHIRIVGSHLGGTVIKNNKHPLKRSVSVKDIRFGLPEKSA